MTNEATLIDTGTRPTIRFERRLRAPLERVWHAVTDPDEMRSWFPSAVVGERKVGAALQFRFDVHMPEGWDGEVIEWEPMRVFAFTWNGDHLRIELAADGDATALVFTHEVYDLSAAARTAAGWHMCLANLDAHLGGPPASPDTWKDTYSMYIDVMGPPLGAASADGSMTWARATHVAPDKVRAVAEDPQPWGGPADAPVRCEVEPTATGSRFRVVHDTAGTDAQLASRWHALLLQLDMFLAADQLVPVEPDRFVADYEPIVKRA